MLGLVNYIESKYRRKDVEPVTVGDVVVVSFVSKDIDNKIRTQIFEGFVIAKKNRGLRSSFIVRKIMLDEGVERIFQLHNPNINSIIVKKHNKVNKAKLYYLRKLKGRALKLKVKVKKNAVSKNG